MVSQLMLSHNQHLVDFCTILVERLLTWQEVKPQTPTLALISQSYGEPFFASSKLSTLKNKNFVVSTYLMDNFIFENMVTNFFLLEAVTL